MISIFHFYVVIARRVKTHAWVLFTNSQILSQYYWFTASIAEIQTKLSHLWCFFVGRWAWPMVVLPQSTSLETLHSRRVTIFHCAEFDQRWSDHPAKCHTDTQLDSSQPRMINNRSRRCRSCLAAVWVFLVRNWATEFVIIKMRLGRQTKPRGNRIRAKSMRTSWQTKT